MGTAAIARPVKPESGTGVKPLSQRERDLRDAVVRVYRKYDGDLTAFLEDRKREKELVKKVGTSR
jgi:hypothetical protein